MLEKVDEYIFNFCSSLENNTIKNNDKIIYIPKFCIGKNIDTNTFLTLKRNNYGFALKTNNSEYLYSQQRKLFVETEEFECINLENETFEDIVEDFQTVDYISVYEKDSKTNTTISYNFLVNGSSYLLLNYFSIDKNQNTTNISFEEDFLKPVWLRQFRFNQKIKNSEKDELRKLYTQLKISKDTHLFYNITKSGNKLLKEKKRENLSRNIIGNILELDKKTFALKKDIDFCFDSIEKYLNPETDIER